MSLNEIAKQVHRTARNKGFWDHSRVKGLEIGDVPPVEITNPSIVPEKLMLIVTEVAEAMEAHRDGDEPLLVEELADVIIRVLDLTQWKGYDIEGAVYAKMRKNQARPRMHGRNC